MSSPTPEPPKAADPGPTRTKPTSSTTDPKRTKPTTDPKRTKPETEAERNQRMGGREFAEPTDEPGTIVQPGEDRPGSFTATPKKDPPPAGPGSVTTPPKKKTAPGNLTAPK